MARASLTKIASVKTETLETIIINNESIEIKQYLPINDKAELITAAVSEILDTKGVQSPLRELIYSHLYMIKYYTNINITDTMIKNAGKTYDLLVLNNIITEIEAHIPTSELQLVYKLIHDTVEVLSNYRTSAMGILDYWQDGRETNISDVETLKQELATLADNTTLNEVLSKLG